MRSSAISPYYTAASFIIAPAVTVVSWVLIYSVALNLSPESRERDDLYVRILTSSLLILVYLLPLILIGALLSFLLTSITSQKWLSSLAVVANLVILGIFYGIFTAAALIPAYGVKKTELNLAIFMIGAIGSLLFAAYLCYLVWREADRVEDGIVESGGRTKAETAVSSTS